MIEWFWSIDHTHTQPSILYMVMPDISKITDQKECLLSETFVCLCVINKWAAAKMKNIFACLCEYIARSRYTHISTTNKHINIQTFEIRDKKKHWHVNAWPNDFRQIDDIRKLQLSSVFLARRLCLMWWLWILEFGANFKNLMISIMQNVHCSGHEWC